MGKYLFTPLCNLFYQKPNISENIVLQISCSHQKVTVRLYTLYSCLISLRWFHRFFSLPHCLHHSEDLYSLQILSEGYCSQQTYSGYGLYSVSQLFYYYWVEWWSSSGASNQGWVNRKLDTIPLCDWWFNLLCIIHSQTSLGLHLFTVVLALI